RGNGQSTNYTYDVLNRLTAASNSLWGQTYTYDGFGNLTAKSQAGGSPNIDAAVSVSYDANNHQVGASYDSNGTLYPTGCWTIYNGGTYCWMSYNAENRLATQTSPTFPNP